jgi:uncharacterized membrane protein (DUF4010 family)
MHWGSDALIGFSVALGCGLLIGVERERRKGRGAGRAPAGVRTFTLVALSGAVLQYLGSTALIVCGALLILLLVTVSHLRSRSRDPGVTTEVALFVSFLLGLLAMREPALAAAGAVVVAALLAAREPLQRFSTQLLSEQELRDALLLAAAALVVLPLVPDRALPWLAGFNPRRMWALVVLIMALQAAGYVALRLAGARIGLALSGLASGFVSSTATVAALGSRARQSPQTWLACVSGAWLSTVATAVQLMLICVSLHPPLWSRLWPPLAAMGAAALLLGLAAFRRSPPGAAAIERGRAFSLRQSVGFALLLTAVSLAVGWVQQHYGEAGARAAAAVAGLADVHAAGASLAGLAAAGRLSDAQALGALLIAVSTNTCSKIVAAWLSGHRRYALLSSAGLVLIAAVAWIGSSWPG